MVKKDSDAVHLGASLADVGYTDTFAYRCVTNHVHSLAVLVSQDVIVVEKRKGTRRRPFYEPLGSTEPKPPFRDHVGKLLNGTVALSATASFTLLQGMA